MKKYLIFMLVLTGLGCSSGQIKQGNTSALVKWVASTNFDKFPYYNSVDELDGLPEDADCTDETCEVASVNGKEYLKVINIDSSNYRELLVGDWTGGECENDIWSVSSDKKFDAKYPREGEEYKWWGSFDLVNGLYIEKGVNNRGDEEHNEALLYYTPSTKHLIYIGTRSLIGVNENGNPIFEEYNGTEFFYFKRCVHA